MDETSTKGRSAFASALDNRRARTIAVAAFVLSSLAMSAAYNIKVLPPLHPDLERYIHIAGAMRELDLGAAVNYHYPPLYPALIAVFSLPPGDPELAARTLGALAAALANIPVFFLARRIFGAPGAILACALFTFRNVASLAEPKSEQVMVLLLFSALLLGQRAFEQKRARPHLLAGAVFGLAFLAKSEAFPYLMLHLLFLAAVALRRGTPELPAKARLARAARCCGLVLVAYFAVAGPYLVKYRADTGRWSLNPKATTLFLIHNELYRGDALYRIQRDPEGEYFTAAQRIYMGGDKKPIDRTVLMALRSLGAYYLVEYAYRFRASIAETLPVDYLQPMLPWLWPIALVLGVWPARGAGSSRRLAKAHLGAMALIPLLMVPLFSGVFPRFYFSLVPWLAVFMGGGIARALLFVTDRTRARRAPAALLGSALLLLAVSGAADIWRAKRDEFYWDDYAFRAEVAAAIKENLPEGCRFMAPLGSPSLWRLGGFDPNRQVILPADSKELIAVYAMATKSRVLVLRYRQGLLEERYDHLAEFLDPDFKSPLFKKVAQSQGPGGIQYIIFELPAVRCGPPREDGGEATSGPAPGVAPNK